MAGRRPSPALVIACIALFVAMGGTGYAALKLPKNSVGSKQIKPGAVSSSKVKNGSLLPADFKAGTLPAGAQGPKGDPGSPGTKGDTGDKGNNGDTGPRGPSDAYSATINSSSGGSAQQSLALPAGDYLAFGSILVSNQEQGPGGSVPPPPAAGTAQCSLSTEQEPEATAFAVATVPGDGFTHDEAAFSVIGGNATLNVNGAFHLTQPGTLVLDCRDATDSDRHPMLYQNQSLQATRVATLHR